MSTISQRLSVLARQPYPIFHSKDLAILWNITNSNSLHTLLKRYAEKKILYRIYKGLYSLTPLEELDSEIVGFKALHSYCYLSTETVLSQAGIMSQIIPKITFVSSISRQFTINKQPYLSRQMAKQYLFNPAGINEKNGLKTASLERAVCDALYFNPHIHLDGKKLLNLEKIRLMQVKIGFPPTPHFYAASK